MAPLPASEKTRIVFLDYLRVIACLMVMLVHACECFYFGDNGFEIASRENAAWVTIFDSACRASVPLFVMASAYLLFPLARPTGAFFRRRLVRVVVPFVLFSCAYTYWFGGRFSELIFNFPWRITGGHLWFVPMLVGLYLLMPLLSPWAEKVSRKELQGWLALSAFTTTFPFLRLLIGTLYGNGWAHVFGEADFDNLPFLWGECGWNSFGTFHYVSGFIGYMLLGFWFRRFAPTLSWRRTLAIAAPLWLVGYAIAALGFWCRLPFDGVWPFARPYPFAVDIETSWEFCSTGVALTVAAYFLVIRKFVAEGVFYRLLVRPLAEASYGTYLVHIFFLVAIMPALQSRLATPCAILACAILTFLLSSAFSLIVRRIPFVGKLICG